MKKIILAILVVLMLAGSAFADCTINLAWTPSTDPNAATQEVWYDPDTTNPGDEVMQTSGDMALSVHSFDITNPASNDEVWIRTLSGDGSDQADSVHIPVGGVAGATSVTVTTICQ